MIVLGERGDDCNILHIIIGPETDNQFNFTGQSVMDITEYLQHMDPNKPCKLVVNPCNSEDQVLSNLAYQEGHRQAQSVLKKIQNNMNKSEKPSKTTKSKPTLQPNKKDENGVNCPLCGGKGKAQVIDGNINPCEICQLIEMGRHASEIPDAPKAASLEDLRKEIQNDYPEQKSSLSRYLDGEEEIQDFDSDMDDMEEDEDGYPSDI